MSLCDVCMSPGACCKRLNLSSPVNPDVGAAMSRESAEHMVLRNGLPFIPTHQAADGTWAYACTQLQPDGRCGIYEARPQLCRDYLPGSDRLCVHYWDADELVAA